MGLGGGDVVQITYVGTLFDQTVMNVLHYVIDGEPDPMTTVPQDLNNFLQEFIGNGLVANDRVTPYLAMFATVYTLQLVRAQRISTERSVLVDAPLGVPGTATGTPGTVNIGTAVTWRTLRSGRRFVSTTHIGGIPSTATVGGVITNAYRNIVNNWAQPTLQGIVEPASTLLFTPGIYHKKPPGPNFDDWQSYVLQTTTRTMRRRTVGLGI
jgi:hypothetical protein